MQVLSKELKEHGYYKKKGLVEKLASKYVGQIAMLDTGDVLQVDCPIPCMNPPIPAEEYSPAEAVSDGRGRDANTPGSVEVASFACRGDAYGSSVTAGNP